MGFVKLGELAVEPRVVYQLKAGRQTSTSFSTCSFPYDVSAQHLACMGWQGPKTDGNVTNVPARFSSRKSHIDVSTRCKQRRHLPFIVPHRGHVQSKVSRSNPEVCAATPRSAGLALTLS